MSKISVLTIISESTIDPFVGRKDFKAPPFYSPIMLVLIPSHSNLPILEKRYILLCLSGWVVHKVKPPIISD